MSVPPCITLTAHSMFRYSLDQGGTFTEHKIKALLGGKMRVENIVTEPSGESAKFIIFGTVHGGDNSGKTLALHLDFRSAYNRECIVNKDDKLASDFEIWTPASQKTDTCVFGVSNVLTDHDFY